MSSESLGICVLCVMLSPLALAGLALINQGLGRSRSAAHAMLSVLCAMAVAAVVMAVVGGGLIGWTGGAHFSVSLGGQRWDVLGREWLSQSNYNPATVAAAAPVVALSLQVFGCALASLIPLSAGSDRWRLLPICLSTAVFSLCTYPLTAHWVWGGGWLTRFADTYGLPRLVDVGGAGVIQVSGGLTALSVAWILGARRGKYTGDGIPTAIPAHNTVHVLFGCMIALVGWMGLEGAAAILYRGSGLLQMPAIVLNAVLCASSGCLAAVLATWLRYQKPDASLSANGWMAGLVAGSAGCGLISPLAAVVTGAVAGLLTIVLAEWFELKLLVDDPGGAITVHAGSGLWGLLSAGMFVPVSSGMRGHQVLAQLLGIATYLGFLLPWVHGVNVVLNRFWPYRVDRDGERYGMDIRELGAGAYPEFVVHSDERMRM